MKFLKKYFQNKARVTIYLGLIIGLMSICVISCKNDFSEIPFDDENEMQIMDYIDEQENLSIFRDLVDYVGKRNLLKTAGSYTVFVPDNDAFNILFTRLSQNGKKITSISDESKEFWINYFNYHLIDKKINTNSLLPGPFPQPTALNNKFIIADIRESYQAIKLNNASTISEYNIELGNGYINIIDQVLIPPTESIYNQLKSTGKYEIMMSLIEEAGLISFLKDSTITLLIESDEKLIQNGFNADSIENLKDWAGYHIIPDSGYFMNQLTANRFYSLYPKEPITFNVDEFGQYSVNNLFKLDQSFENGIDRVCSNGIYHSLDTVLQIVEAVPSTIRLNLYPPGSPYGEQNVFTKAPARIVLNTGTQSYHQNKENLIVAFDAQQVGDYFWLTFSDVPSGKYRIRMIHRQATSRGKFLVIYNNSIIAEGIDLRNKNGSFEDWNYLSYNYCGELTVDNRSDVTLTFVMTAFAPGKVGSYCCDVLMDMIELIPII